jgi:hypothetical protein
MNQGKEKSVNISAPNLLAICVNGLENGEIQGRLYHYYGKEPICFFSILDLIRAMENLFDDLVFPQASTKSRSFFEKEAVMVYRRGRKEKTVSWEDMFSHEGTRGTFITCVKFRQRSTWQGDFFWKEKGEKVYFSSALEFIRQLELALNQSQETEERRGADRYE